MSISKHPRILGVGEDDHRLELALAIAKACVWEISIKERRVIGGEALSEMFGRPISWEDIRRPDQIFAKEELAHLAAFLARVSTQLTEFDLEHKIVRTDGSTRWVQTHGRSFAGADGKVERLLLHSADITERKLLELELEAALRAASEGLRKRRTLIEDIHQDIFGDRRDHAEPTEDTAASAGESSLHGMAASLHQIWADIELRDETLADAVQALRKARAEAHAASVAKSQFLATMTHELRTPLNAIINFSEILAEDLAAGDKASLADVERVRAAGLDLLALLDNIFDLSDGEDKAESIQSFHVGEFVARLIQPFRSLAEARGLTLSAEVDQECQMLATNERALRKCLCQILGNAFKFTSRGGVRITARLRLEEGRRFCDFAIHDTGIGIGEEKRAGLFSAFEQRDSSVTRKHGGAGLGLAIAKKMADGIQARIEIESQPDRGSTFTVRVPCRSGA